jgi:hypothetical protein
LHPTLVPVYGDFASASVHRRVPADAAAMAAGRSCPEYQPLMVGLNCIGT